MYSTTQAYTPGANLDATRSLLIGMKEKGTLQSYVAQHKNSPEYPYLLALASSINQISNATQAAQHQPAPQTVADQQLNALAPAPAPQAAPLPEDVGIGQLPAPNLKKMAGGGIIAFDEGGEVPRFQNKGLVQGWSQYAPSGYGNTLAAPPTAEEINEYNRQSRMGFGESLSEFLSKARSAVTGLFPETKSTVRNLQSTTRTVPDTASIGATQDAEDARAAVLQGTQPTPAVDRSGLDKTGMDKTVTDRTGTEKPSADKAGLASLAAPGVSSKSAIKDLEAAVYKNAPDKMTMMSEMEAIDKPYLDKARANIEKEAKRLESDKEQDFYMSLIEGGLAAAGGESMYALQNIAKGGQKGVSSFSAALKDFRKATQENSRAEMELARYEATGKKDALKSYNEAQAKRDDRYAAGITALRAQEMQTQGTITAAGISAAASRDLANSYRAPAFAEQIRQHLAKELDADPRFKYDATAKSLELQRRLEQELKKYPGMAQYAGAPGGGGAVDTTGFKVLGSRPSQ